MQQLRKYWFPAKRYGWGWGLPIAWQGWCVLLSYLALVLSGIVLFPPGHKLIAFWIYITVITVMLIAVCYAKGEPPGWRWGDK